MCSSCFANTKYICLKCQIPNCNKCSTFEHNEDTERSAAGRCEGCWKSCFREESLEHSDGGKTEEKHEKPNGQDMTKESAKYVFKYDGRLC